MIEKKVVTGKIEIYPNNVIGLRIDTVFFENGIEVSRKLARKVLEPGMDIGKESDPRIKAVTDNLWTKEVIEAFKIDKANRMKSIGKR